MYINILKIFLGISLRIRSVNIVFIMLILCTIVCVVVSMPATGLPLVDPGLFVISGVKTCGNNTGYCLLGPDCTTDDDFLPDPIGHCDGLKRAFTPSAPFSCCKYNNRTNTPANIAGNNLSTIPFTELKNRKMLKNAWGQVDPTQSNTDQLEKLHDIENAVKKIIEQFISETAKHIKPVDITVHNDFDTEKPSDENLARTENPVNDEINTQDTVIIDAPKTEEITTEENNIEITPIEESKKEIKPIEESEKEIELKTENSDEPQSVELEDEVEIKSEKIDCQKACKSEVTFIENKKPICYGSLIDDIWILTSATCASRLHKIGLRKVLVSRKTLNGIQGLGISNILVHEDFKSPALKNAPDHNDLALVSLSEPLFDEVCHTCIQTNNVTNQVCKNFQGSITKNTVKNVENCEDRLSSRNFIKSSYYILPCNRWRMQYNKEGRLGSGLWCDDRLAGIQTGVGVGSLIYTPVNEHAVWISDNKRIDDRR